MTGLTALVLAGGAARRMGGGDKPLRAIGGTTILARVLEVLRPDAMAMAISANGDPARFAAYGLPVLADGGFAGLGPLAGVLAGLGWAEKLGADALLTAPGDTPFLPAGLAATLAPAPAFAASGGRDHPLVALWPVAARAALRAWLEEGGSRAAARFAARIGARRVVFADEAAFANVNTPDDLEAARARFAGGR